MNGQDPRGDGAAGTRLVLLGTGGGPWPSASRAGIAQAVVVNDHAYLVDCGSGVARQLVRARLLGKLRGVFVTHLHSDHTVDYFSLFLLGWPGLQRLGRSIDTYGPGPAGGPAALPPDASQHPLPPVGGANPTPGLADLTRHQIQAHAYDLNVRMRDTGFADLSAMVTPHEISLPVGLDAGGPDRVAPAMEPIVVAENDDVRVTAILVAHAPVFPSFAYRFDTADGAAVVISGDTAPCANLVRLARGADVLVHEVLDADYMRDWLERAPGAEAGVAHLLASHTALEDVGKVAADAGVGTLVLTHFIPSHPLQADEHWVQRPRADFGGPVIAGTDLLDIPVRAGAR